MLKNKGENMIHHHSKITVEIEIIPNSPKKLPIFFLIAETYFSPDISGITIFVSSNCSNKWNNSEQPPPESDSST